MSDRIGPDWTVSAGLGHVESQLRPALSFHFKNQKNSEPNRPQSSTEYRCRGEGLAPLIMARGISSRLLGEGGGVAHQIRCQEKTVARDSS
jgi:hypothetical protein